MNFFTSRNKSPPQVIQDSSNGSLHTSTSSSSTTSSTSSSSRMLNSLGSNLFSHLNISSNIIQPMLSHSSSFVSNNSTPDNLLEPAYTSQRRSRSPSNASTTANSAISFIPQQLMSLSGVLNDPKSLKFSKLDLSSSNAVPVVPLKRVKLSDFDNYIKSIQGYYDQYAENMKSGFAATGTLKLGTVLKFPDPREDPESPSASLYSLLGLDKKPATPLIVPKLKPPNTADPVHNKPLSTVPNVFFQPDFSLENPRIFDLVSESLDVTLIDPALQALGSYIDIVEEHLTSEISARSSSFFNALTNLTELHHETGACLSQIDTLRARLTQLSAIHATKALETVHLTQKRANVAKLLDVFLAMHSVSDAVHTVHSLLQQSDYVAALQVLSECAPSIQATSNIYALQVVHTRLFDMGRTLGHLLVDELVKELSQFVFNTAVSSTKDPSFSTKTQASKISPLVHCLIRIDGLGYALTGYQYKLVNEIRSMIRKLYPPELIIDSRSSPNATKDTTLSPFIKALKALNLQQFLSLLDSVYDKCTQMLKQLIALHAIVQDAISEAEQHHITIGADKHLVGILTPPTESNPTDDDEFRSPRAAPDAHLIPPMSPVLSATSHTDGKSTTTSTYDQFRSANTRILSSVMDFAHVRIAKLVTGRSDQNAQLSLKDFARLYTTAFQFISAFDTHAASVLAGSNGPVALKTALQSQARAFTVHFHMERMKQLSMLVENETWVQADVLNDFQSIVDRIMHLVDGGMVDAQSRRQILALASSEGALNADDSIPDNLDKAAGSISSKSSTANANSSKVLIMGTLQFPVAGVVLMLAKMIDDYLQVVEAIPALATDIHSKIVALLKSFNSRTCQMILGAGAVESAGLKSISAKHLAISSQSLGAVISLIPSIRNYLAFQMNDKQSVFLNEYNKITKDYTEHQDEVYAKLVAIMQERVAFHSKSLGLVNWEDQHVPVDENTLPPPTPAMDALVKETITLHKVLARYLPSETLRMVMSHVFVGFNSKLEVEMNKIILTSASAKTALLIDVQFFIRKLNALEGVDGPGSHLENVVNEMKITDKETAAAQRIALSKKSVSQSGKESQQPATITSNSPKPNGQTDGDILKNTPLPNSTADLPSATQSLTASQSSTNLLQSGNVPATPSKFSSTIGGFNLKSWTTGSVPSGTLPVPGSLPRTAQHANSNVLPTTTPMVPNAAVGAAVMNDAAQKTKQFASDWMKKMTFMKQDHT